MLHRSSLVLVLGLFGILTLGCEAKPAKPQVEARTNIGNEIAVGTPTAPIGERLLDTSPAPSPARALAAAPTPAPVTTTRAPKIRRPGSDENLPSWVPVRGRLSVVEAPDLAENLGLVPKGTTRASQTRISVADALTAPAAATATATATASAAAPRTDTGPRSATWLASNGRVRHGRGR
jgi:hypothetical protein